MLFVFQSITYQILTRIMAASGQPSWKVEPRFKTGVLVGNWYEERLQVTSKLVCL